MAVRVLEDQKVQTDLAVQADWVVLDLVGQNGRLEMMGQNGQKMFVQKLESVANPRDVEGNLQAGIRAMDLVALEIRSPQNVQIVVSADRDSELGFANDLLKMDAVQNWMFQKLAFVLELFVQTSCSTMKQV